jgi:glycosyltransferase involved in cell wall biosynthesis
MPCRDTSSFNLGRSPSQESPLISIIIPAYNHERYVEKTLDSIASDPYPLKELLIIDDGSQDNTRSVILAWIEKQDGGMPIKFKSRQNRGISFTLNELISMASGSFISHIASDDYLVGNSIWRRYQYLRDHSDKLYVFADAIIVDAQDRQISPSLVSDFFGSNHNVLKSDQGLRRNIIERWGFVGPTAMYRAETSRIIGKYDETIRSEDIEFALRLSAQNKIGYLDEVLGARRIHGENISHTAEFKITIADELYRIARKNMHAFPWSDRFRLFLRFVYPAWRQCVLIIVKQSAFTSWMVPIARAIARGIRR